MLESINDVIDRQAKIITTLQQAIEGLTTRYPTSDKAEMIRTLSEALHHNVLVMSALQAKQY